jgi:hypothetical protein
VILVAAGSGIAPIRAAIESEQLGLGPVREPATHALKHLMPCSPAL